MPLDDDAVKTLEDQLEKALWNNYNLAEKDLGYKANFFAQMLTTKGAKQTVTQLVMRKDPSDGFTVLWENKRLDLSVEAVILDPKWSPLLDPDVIKFAKKRLQAFGYTPAAIKEPKPIEIDPLVVALQDVLKLQPLYASKNTSDMKSRGVLIRNTIPDLLRSEIIPQLPIGYDWKVEGSDGVGLKGESPWVRIFDDSYSPSATHGWYVVLHFSRDGRALFVNLGCGATSFKNGSLVPVATEILGREIKWAKDFLANAEGISKFSDFPKLGGNKLSEQFERAIAFCRSYSAEAINAKTVAEDIQLLAEFLAQIYQVAPLGKGALAPDPILSEVRDQIEDAAGKFQGRKGQGRGLTAAEKKAVELHSMELARKEMIRLGFSDIKNCSATKPYDYEAVKGGEIRFIEIKGTTSSEGGSILLTPGEKRFHEGKPGKTILIIVCDISLTRGEVPIASGGKVRVFSPWDFSTWLFEPTGYEVSMG